MHVGVIDCELRGRVQQFERPFLWIEPADKQQHAAAGRNAERREIDRRRVGKPLDVDAVGNHGHLRAGQAADLCGENRPRRG